VAWRTNAVRAIFQPTVIPLIHNTILVGMVSAD
jgi:hypothetical protein